MRPSKIPASASARAAIMIATLLAAPALVAISFGGCGPKEPPANPNGVGAASADAGAQATVTAPSADAAPALDAAPSTSGYWPAPDAGAQLSTPDAAPPPPCWAGFKATGNAAADVSDLGGRCAKGMSQVIPPVKQNFAQGERKQIPLIVAPGCYRIIAVGGTGVKDVDLEIRDNAGKLIAADNTPDDIFPMIHPNKEWCPDAAQILTLSIIVKKGSGEVAGGVWKR
jgi:hypothetical protein